jgi:large subunit ribosomal protein L24
MIKLKLKKDDIVTVIAGKEKGKTGKVIDVIKAKNRVLVAGLNIVKKHEKPNPKNEKGGIIDKEASIALSNLMLLCSKCNKGVRVKIEKDDTGKTVRNCKKCASKI